MAKRAKSMSKILFDIEKKLSKNIDIIIENTINELVDQFEHDVADMMKEAADAFYNDYTPNSYRRHKRKPTLANMYNVKLSGTYLSVELGGEFSTNKHRVSNEYIYEKMFKGGWHGGSTDNKSPETLWYSRWNDVDNSWDSWNRPAEHMKGDTPYEIFMKNYDDYITNDFYVIAKDITKKNMMKIIQGRK